MPHHTGSKGDIGVARAIAEFMERGYDVCLPVSSTCPFDLVALKDGQFLRVQVKYRTTIKGTFRVDLNRASIGGGKVRRVKNTEVDLVCVFNPDTQRCYFFSPAMCPLRVRLTPAKNGQSARVHLVDEFVDIPGLRAGSEPGEAHNLA